MSRPSAYASVVPSVLLASIVLALLPMGRAAGQVAHQGTGPLDRLVVADPRLGPAATTVPFQEVVPLLPAAVRDAWAGFLAAAGGEWQGYVDQRTGRLEAVEGSGIRAHETGTWRGRVDTTTGQVRESDPSLRFASLLHLSHCRGSCSTRPFKEEPLS